MILNLQSVTAIARKNASGSWTAEATLLSNLEFYIEMDSDGTSSTGSNNATVSGATNTTGFFGNGYSTDGVNDYLSSGYAPTLTSGGGYDFAVGFYFKTSANTKLMTGCRNVSNSNSGMWVYVDGSGNVQVRTRTNTPQETNTNSTGTAWNDGAWHRLIYTIKQGEQRLWIDGTNVASASATITGDIDLTLPYYLGGRNEGGAPVLPILCVFDEWFMKSEFMSAEQIALDWDGGNGLPYN